ncbi:DUF3027 domain-containing protein [Streptomyces bohaiensis]|uniref:DUF3027 domain-containing protein n=1 Tax=Streptomyces bohaiensis TaxID=1431344 RepID=UPI003B7DC66D
MSAATRSRTPDRLCADAVPLAREVAEEAAFPHPVGPHLGAEGEGEGGRVVTHFFESVDPAYRGWRWGVTVVRAARARHVTVDEVTLFPGEDALLAPQWLPWSERLRPGDLGPGDLLPVEEGDPRLEPGFALVEEAADSEAEAEGARVPADATPEASAVAAAGVRPSDNRRAETAALADELGLGRTHVLSRLGLAEAAERWDENYGPGTPMAQGAPASCISCGFLVPLAGSLRQGFGVCANEYAPADGRVVSLGFGCGAHSEAATLMPKPAPRPSPVIDHVGADPL